MAILYTCANSVTFGFEATQPYKLYSTSTLHFSAQILKRGFPTLPMLIDERLGSYTRAVISISLSCTLPSVHYFAAISIYTRSLRMLKSSSKVPSTVPSMSALVSLLLVSLLTFSFSHFTGATSCTAPDLHDPSSTLPIMHLYGPCSPFKPPPPKSEPSAWQANLLEMASRDGARLQYLNSLQAVSKGGQKTILPIGSGRQILQIPNYIVKASLGTPPQPLLLALDTSNDVAWIPCSGCTGCSSTVFDTAKSPTYKPLGCDAPQCKQFDARVAGTELRIMESRDALGFEV
ncbi:hypothetical protein ACLOJK_024659 [Asimina triloba]